MRLGQYLEGRGQPEMAADVWVTTSQAERAISLYIQVGFEAAPDCGRMSCTMLLLRTHKPDIRACWMDACCCCPPHLCRTLWLSGCLAGRCAALTAWQKLSRLLRTHSAWIQLRLYWQHLTGVKAWRAMIDMR